MPSDAPDLTPARLRALADEWRMLDLQPSMTEAEIARYDKLPLRMAMALQAVANLIERHAATLAARDALLRRAGEALDCFGACAPDWDEMGSTRIVNQDRVNKGDKPILVFELRIAQTLVAEIAAALTEGEP